MDDVFLEFEGLQAPVHLHRAPALPDLMRRVLPFWPFRVIEPGGPAGPCVTIRAAGADAFDVTIAATGETRRLDDVNSVCDMIAELGREQLRSEPALLCLHAAAVEFAGRLVVFPNRRRAGKSTLTACLGRAGHRIFTDDFLPLQVGPDRILGGRANGILPRIRLPLPEEFSPPLTAWIADNPGPSNAQYKYLEVPALAKRGDWLPIGAVVFLDRDAARDAPSLEPIDRQQAMDAIVFQNFARTQHSGRILRAFEALVEGVPLINLSYASAEIACDTLTARFVGWDAPPPVSSAALDGAPAEGIVERIPFDEAAAYIRTPGATETELDGALYLADPGGAALHKLNAGSLALWRLLSEAMTLDEIVDTMAAAFPAADPAAIRQDMTGMMRRFSDAGLICRPGPGRGPG